jgi:hypothetical protein
VVQTVARQKVCSMRLSRICGPHCCVAGRKRRIDVRSSCGSLAMLAAIRGGSRPREYSFEDLKHARPDPWRTPDTQRKRFERH